MNGGWSFAPEPGVWGLLRFLDRSLWGGRLARERIVHDESWGDKFARVRVRFPHAEFKGICFLRFWLSCVNGRHVAFRTTIRYFVIASQYWYCGDYET